MFVKLIDSDAEYDYIRRNFDIKINKASVSLINLIYISGEEEEADLLSSYRKVTGKVVVKKEEDSIVKIENENKKKEKVFKKSDYNEMMGLLFVWHSEENMVTYYIYQILSYQLRNNNVV